MRTLFGKPFDYWADVLAVMETHMILTPEELEGRLGPGILFSTEMVNRIKRVLIGSVGDMRWYPHCHKTFTPDDTTSYDALKLYRVLFPERINGTSLTDEFQEWNW